MVERILGKDEVRSSTLRRGSVGRKMRFPRVSSEIRIQLAGYPNCGGIAQAVEQAAHNRCVAGSSPAPATRRCPTGVVKTLQTRRPFAAERRINKDRPEEGHHG